MSINFPTSLDTLTTGIGASGNPLSSPNHITQHTNESQAIEALEAKVGVDSSAVTSSLDYKLKSASSINPGHKHTASSLTMTLDDLSDVVITAVADGNGLIYSGANSRWENASSSVADASTTVKGIAKISVAPASPTSPIAVGDNDTRVPTQGENDALVGDDTSIAIGTGNKFVSQTGFQKGSEIYAADSVGTDSYAITLSPVPAAYVTGQRFFFKAGTANTGACTLNVNTLGAKTIKKQGQYDLADNDIVVGQIVEVVYDGTNMQMLSQLANGSSYAFGNMTDLVTTTAQNNDATITTGFTPRLIKLHYFLQGWVNGTTTYRGIKGIAMYSGTTLVGFTTIWGAHDGAGSALSGDDGTLAALATSMFTNVVNSNDANGLVVGSSAATSIKVTLTIASISSTGFVIRPATTVGSANASNGRARIYYEAFA